MKRARLPGDSPKTAATSSTSPSLPHLDARGAARMVGVGAKPETARRAVASATVRMSAATLALVARGAGARGKGDALATARLAAVMACKRTAELIPLCHPVRVVGTDVSFAIDHRLPGVLVEVAVDAVDRTGVEMEAMVGASVAALTIYDMVKGVERDVEIGAVRLLEKSGGRSGSWRRDVKPIRRSASNRKG
jgi:cyclic pyranopterin phosphate synthase